MVRHAAVVFVLLVTGCGGQQNAGPPTREPDVSGAIASAEPIGGAEGGGGIALLVKGSERCIDQAAVRATDVTRVYDSNGDDLGPQGFEALQPDRRVRVWFTGPVAESCPVQAEAGSIVLED